MIWIILVSNFYIEMNHFILIYYVCTHVHVMKIKYTSMMQEVL